MFVSSYNTYINTNSSQRNTKSSAENTQSDTKLFATKLAQSTPSKSLLNSNTPINYVNQNNASYNKELLRSEQEYKKDSSNNEFKKTAASTAKFSTNLTLSNAKVAYTENSSLFSFLRKPQASLDQTPKVDATVSKNIQEVKESNIRHTMVNTYVENDRYYQITA